MFHITFTDEDRKALLTFLERVDLKGPESFMWVRLYQIVAKALPVKEDEVNERKVQREEEKT